MINILFILLLIFAGAAIMTERPVRGAVYLGVFSLLCAFIFMLYQAPDVALAEAIIGSTLATILYLVALYQYVE